MKADPWNYIWAAYGVGWTTLALYTLSLLARRQRANKKAGTQKV